MADQPAPGAPEQRGIDPVRVLDKVQDDPTGALLIRNAVQACIIEDLRAELVRVSSAQGGAPVD